MKNVGLFLVIFAAVLVLGCAQGPSEPAKTPAEKDPVQLGKALFQDPSLGTTGSTCKTCHPNPETTMKGVGARYPGYFGMAKKEMTLKEVINFCIETPMKGKPLAENDEKLLALEAYLKSL
jgi:thiosulfate dehydrogenase